MDGKLFYKVGEKLVKNSPTILTGFTVIGTGILIWLSGRAAIKAEKLWGEYHLANPEIEENWFNKVQVCWKPYAPVFAVAAGTIASAIGSNAVSLRRSAALVSGYKMLEEAAKVYSDKVVATIGENKDRKIKEEISQDRLDTHPVSASAILPTGNGNALFFDALSARYFYSDLERIRQTVNSFNFRLMR